MDVVVEVADKHRGKSKEETLVVLDAEVERFSTFMASMRDWRVQGPLLGGEKALLKTYLVHKLNGKIDGVK